MIVIVILLLCVLFYGLFILPTQWLKVERNKEDLGMNQKFLQLSDLHMERLRISPEKIQGVLQKERPHAIFLTGDYYDQSHSKEKFERYLTVFKDSGIPVYAVLGNHDYYLKKDAQSEQQALLKRYGVKLLKNEKVELEDYTIVGLDDFCTKHHNENVFESINQEKPVILLQHDPNYALYAKHSFDLMLSGHLHGKQFNVPFLFRLKPMGEASQKGLYKGLHATDKGKLYISKGLGQSGFNFRLFVRSEVTIHEL